MILVVRRIGYPLKEIPVGASSSTVTITLKLDGYQLAKRTVEASEGGTVPINQTLRQK